MDHLSRSDRSALMARIGNKDTRPERAVRRLVHQMGYRYRLHRHDLPGRPDLVFPGRRKIVFVHGCFWHRHDCRRGGGAKANADYWEAKISRNAARDRRNVLVLVEAGWKVHVVWECELKDLQRVQRSLHEFLEG
jgi:DNA mismatch endonuclease (patch repair protein)